MAHTPKPTYVHRVIIESPFHANSEQLSAGHLEYARMCVRHSIMRGEAPIAFHILYTQPRILNDKVPAERALGMSRARHWYECADICAVYTDMGVSKGMQIGIDYALSISLRVEYRKLGSVLNV